MGLPERYDDAFVAGDTYKLLFKYKDTDGLPIDLTGYTVDMEMRRSIKDEDYVLNKNWVISAEDGIEGYIKLLLTVDDTQFLSECSAKSIYVYDLQITDPTGDTVQTLIGGTLEVLKGVTR